MARILKSWYTGGGPEQRFRRCSLTNLIRSLIPPVAQSKTINELLSFDTYYMTESDEFSALYQNPITKAVSISIGYLSCQTVHLDVCIKAWGMK